MQIHVSYIRQFEKDGKHCIQHVSRAVDIGTDDDIAEIREFYVRYLWDMDHPMSYRPQLAYPFAWG